MFILDSKIKDLTLRVDPQHLTIPVDPSDDASDDGGFSGRVSPNEQATDPKKHTLVRITYNLSSPALTPETPIVDA